MARAGGRPWGGSMKDTQVSYTWVRASCNGASRQPMVHLEATVTNPRSKDIDDPIRIAPWTAESTEGPHDATAAHRSGEVGETEPNSPPDAVNATSAVVAPESATGVPNVGNIDDIAQAIATGAIDADTATAQLVRAAVDALFPSGIDPKLARSLHDEIEALLAQDPTLTRLLTR